MSDRVLRMDGEAVDPERLFWMEARKKPVVVEATAMPAPFEVETMEGTMEGDEEDVLIRGVEGELYPCSLDVFDQTYELVAVDDDGLGLEGYAGPVARGAVAGVLGGLVGRAIRRIYDA